MCTPESFWGGRRKKMASSPGPEKIWKGKERAGKKTTGEGGSRGLSD